MDRGNLQRLSYTVASRAILTFAAPTPGSAFWNLLSVTPVFDANGRLTSYIGVQSDITELIQSKVSDPPPCAHPAHASLICHTQFEPCPLHLTAHLLHITSRRRSEGRLRPMQRPRHPSRPSRSFSPT